MVVVVGEGEVVVGGCVSEESGIVLGLEVVVLGGGREWGTFRRQ